MRNSQQRQPGITTEATWESEVEPVTRAVTTVPVDPLLVLGATIPERVPGFRMVAAEDGAACKPPQCPEENILDRSVYVINQ